MTSLLLYSTIIQDKNRQVIFLIGFLDQSRNNSKIEENHCFLHFPDIFSITKESK